MEIFKIFVIVISVSCFCFLLFQLWFFIENQEYIYLFNEKYSKLEYVASPNMYFIDKNVFDPNDSETDVNKKFRCGYSNTNHLYYGFSEDGFISKNSSYIDLTWTNLTDCISDIFKTNTIIIYNPCINSETSTDCIMLKQLMIDTS